MDEHRGDQWDPEVYRRFDAERARPFHDLLGLLAPSPGGSLVDLGCGTGELTALAARTLRAGATLGIDNSPDMLGRAEASATPTVSFELGDIATLGDRTPFDVVLANASLQWVPDHAAVLADWAGHLRPGGQLAVQVPANSEHPSHTTIAEVLSESPWFDELGGAVPEDPVARSVRSPAEYAEMLWSLGATDQVVRMQVYGMELPGADAVVDWTSGTTLVRVRRVLSPESYDTFVERYRERLAERLEHRAPYYYAFQRILMWARFD